MMRKRDFKTSMLLWFCHYGWLCKTRRPLRKGFRLSRSIMPDGTTIMHNGFVVQPPQTKNILEAQIHGYHEMKKYTAKKYKAK